MAFTATDFRNKIREFLDDTPTSHMVKPDDLSAQVDGVKTQFFASNQNLVSGVKASKDGGALAPVTSEDDLALGIVSVSPAPQTSLQLVYFYLFFTDAQIDSLRDHGLQRTGFDSTTLANVPPGLFSVVCLYAAAQGFRTLAGRHATKYDASVEGKSFSKGSLFEHYMQLAEEFEEKADKERLAFYGDRQGRSTEARSKIQRIAYPGGLYTPIR